MRKNPVHKIEKYNVYDFTSTMYVSKEFFFDNLDLL